MQPFSDPLEPLLETIAPQFDVPLRSNVAPFALSFYQTEAVAAWNQVILGLLIGGDAIWALAQRPTASHA